MTDNKEDIVNKSTMAAMPTAIHNEDSSQISMPTINNTNVNNVRCPKSEDNIACSKFSNLSLDPTIIEGDSKSLDNHLVCQQKINENVVDNGSSGDYHQYPNIVPNNVETVPATSTAIDLNSNFWNDPLPLSELPPPLSSHPRNDFELAYPLLNLPTNVDVTTTTNIEIKKENGENNNEMEPGVIPMETEDNPVCEQQEPLIEIKISDIKTDFSEFDDFVLLFLFVCDVEDCTAKFDSNSVTLTFKTNYDPRKGANKDTMDEQKIYHFILKMDFKNEIVPEKCSWKAKKKSIEIRLEKKVKRQQWGLVLDSNQTNARTALIRPTVVNQNIWTPCTFKKKDMNDDDDDDDFNANVANGKAKFYGFTGLVNVGNTCFMNSVLQCLANTDPLKEYFLSDKYLKDINTSNPLGSKGMVAKAFAQFLTQLWMGRQSSFTPTRLKSLMSDRVASFAGYSQHDAQEFMSFLLDAIHEDLKRPNPGCKTMIQNGDGTDDGEESLLDHDVNDCPNSEMMVKLNERLKELADKAWNHYLANNSSIVTDLFCGQFKSLLTCPDCLKKSVIFDPFLFVPLPIPPPKDLYYIAYFARDHATGMCKKISRFWVKMCQNETVNELLNYMHQNGITPPNNRVRLMKQQPEESMPVKFFNSNWVLSDHYHGHHNNSPQSPLLLFELPEDMSDEYIELCVIQREYATDDDLNHMRIPQVGLPFLVTLKRSMLTYSHLCAVLCSYARHSVVAHRQASTDPSTNTQTVKRFNVQAFTPKNHPINSSRNDFSSGSGYHSSSPSPELPHLIYYKTTNLIERDTIAPFLLHKWIGEHKTGDEIKPMIISEHSMEQNSSDNESEDREPIVYDNDQILNLNDAFLITMDWITTKNFSECSFAILLGTLDCNEDDFVGLINVEVDITLDDCLRCFIEPEMLGPQNCWRCPKCKVNREASKQLSFWRLPPILVIQLKRFRAHALYFSTEKITSLVKYPINGLDLKKYCCNVEKNLDDNGKPVEPVYDLYAVVNHMGTPFFGHYTAYARSSNGELGWRLFDDTTVEKVSEYNVVSAKAYILFYKRRDS